MKNLFKKENVFYTLIFIVSIIVIIVNRIFVGFKNILWIADIGTICGVLNVIYTAKHSVFGLIFNAISSSFIVATSIIQHVWLTAFITLFISIPFLIVGIFNWNKNQKNNEEEKNLKTMRKNSLILLISSLIVVDAIFTIILYFLKGNLFYLDAIVSSCCLMGIILSSKMFLEQFYFFIPGNFCGIIMYSLLSTQNINNLPYAFLFIIDFIVVIMGLVNWKKLVRIKQSKSSFLN